MSNITCITDQNLIQTINSAQERVTFIAPGLWTEVADALSQTWQRLGRDAVSIILDVDPEVCRLGYGNIDALKSIQQTAQEMGGVLCHEPGIRIALIIADHQTIFYTPTPQLIEAPPGTEPSSPKTSRKVNAIVLNKPPEDISTELGHTNSEDPHDAAEKRTFGMDAANPGDIDNVEKDLIRNPPKVPVLSRTVNVYNAHIRFVELKIHGYQFSKFKADLPPEIQTITLENRELSDRIDNSIRLIKGDESLVGTEEVNQFTIDKKRKNLTDSLCIHVAGGVIIERSKIEGFEKGVEELKQDLASLTHSAEEQLNNLYANTIEGLVAELSPVIAKTPPSDWFRSFGPPPTLDDMTSKLRDELWKSFGDPKKRIGNIQLTLTYKDVTYDMLKNDDFISEIQTKIPHLQHITESSAIKANPTLNV